MKRRRSSWRWLLYLVLGLLVTPLWLLWGLVRTSGRVLRVGVSLVDVVPCPDGHPNRVYGTWVCRGCGARFRGYAFAPCPVCGGVAAYISCESCGLAIRAPFRE